MCLTSCLLFINIALHVFGMRLSQGKELLRAYHSKCSSFSQREITAARLPLHDLWTSPPAFRGLQHGLFACSYFLGRTY